MSIGLDDGQELKRKKPVPFNDAVALLASDSGIDTASCEVGFERFLTHISLPETERGGTGAGAFLAFKLHRFIAGAGEIFTTLAPQPRNVLFEGQLEDPDAPGHRLYPTRFCRECGHEVHVVTKVESPDGASFLPRDIDDTPLDDPDGDAAGYLTPVGEDDPEYSFTGEIESYPEEWREERNGVERLRSNRKRRAPQRETVGPAGLRDPLGRPFWFIPGKFGFCPCCLSQPQSGMRERTKLPGLSGEGRSSATTLLVSTALEWMNRKGNGIPAEKRKLLGFTDNRQDAALQAGHFNDFLFVSLLRGAILRAVLDAGEEGIAEDEFGIRVLRALGFTAANKEARIHWMLEPEAGAVVREDAQRSLAKVLAHRVWTDLRRGWRYTNPSLSVLKLIEVAFIGLDDIAEDAAQFTAILPSLGDLDAAGRRGMLRKLLGTMLEGLAVNTEALDLTALDGVGQKSRNLLRVPWAIDAKETPRSRTTLILQAPSKDVVGLREEQTIIRAGHNSRVGRLINRKSVLGTKLAKADYLTVMTGLMEILAREGLVTPIDIEDDLRGWRLSPSAVRLVPGEAVREGARKGNPYFHDLYNAIAADLRSGRSSYWGLEGREHTAQVSQRQREWREWRFRFEPDDRKLLTENAADLKATGESEQFLPALFCSPTMELGVDISALNAVYLRNVPPTPANYAQRAGRAGRSGQAAVIVTYCAAQSPHDQYFFERRREMVAGVVNPPALDITNEELVRSHLHAVWLAEAKVALSPDIPEILDLKQPKFPLKQEVRDIINRPALEAAAQSPMKRVLDQVLASVDGRRPSWMGEPLEFVQEVARTAPEEFDRAFDRWRDLYSSARAQLTEANARSLITGLSAADRRKVKAAQMQATRFGIEAAAVTAGGAARLERGLPLAQTLFDAYPFTVVSLDYIKADKRRDGFSRSCPDFVIVDEAHACVGTQRGKQQRFELLSELARNPERRMVLLTATPHSGDEEAFGRLLSLVDPDFASMAFEDAKYRERLARHFVQRRRIDLVSSEWDEERTFPKHEETDFAYRLSKAHLDFQEAALDYCFDVVARAGSGQRERRLAYWGTLALMRCIGSSPAAGLSALRNRIANEIERLEPQIYDDDGDDEDAVDIEPSAIFETDPALQALVKRAEALLGQADPKMTALVDVLTPLIRGGANPVVFCRYLATAEHVRDGLRKAFPKLVVESVTGVLTPDERRDRVADMAQDEDGEKTQRILVATDCLSEGINLQLLFDTVIHYDLCWNPTRHQQREGRVDRFGQPAKIVRSIMMFSPDSAIDGAVLDVILRKAKTIRDKTGVTVPLPEERGPVTDALMAAMMLKRGVPRQLVLDLRLEDGARAMDVQWRDAEENEKKSRARFAQNAMKPREVAPEWEKVRTLLGSPADAKSFIDRSMARFGVALEPKKSVILAHVDALEPALRARLKEHDLTGSVRLALTEPAPSGSALLTRTHPLTAALADALVEASLEPDQLAALGVGRVGAWPTAAVERVTRVALLRIRFKLTIHARRERMLLAEEAALVAIQGAAVTASGEAARALLNAPSTANLAPPARDRFVAKAQEDLPALLDGPIAEFARARAVELMQDHARLRAAAGSASRVTVEAVLPPDVIGLFILMPSEA